MYTLSLTFLFFFLIYRSNSFLPWSPGRGRESGWTSCSTRSEGVRQWEPLPAVRTLWFHFTLTTNLINSVVFVFICVYRRQWGSRRTEGGSVAAEGHEDEVPDDPQERPGAGCRCWVSSSGLVSVDAVFVRGDRETVRPWDRVDVSVHLLPLKGKRTPLWVCDDPGVMCVSSCVDMWTPDTVQLQESTISHEPLQLAPVDEWVEKLIFHSDLSFPATVETELQGALQTITVVVY